MGSISKNKWQQIRNNTIYSRGDKTKKGNPNIRIVGNQLWINDPETGWLKGKLWINKPVNQTCYDARIQLKGGKFHVTFSWEELDPPKITDKSKGVIGIDTNPNGEALTEINSTGNIQSHVFLKNNRIQFARSGKRDYDIKQMAVKIVSIALQAGKPIVLEKLKFKNKRPAAYTSIVGKLKYMDMYSLSVHNAAALVIGRLGFLNQSDKVVVDVSGVKTRPTLEARGRSVTLEKKSFLWFKSKFRVCARNKVCQKQPTLTGPCLVPS